MKASLYASVVLLCACGAATGPLVDETPLDSGPLAPDAGRFDSGLPIDAGTRPDGLVFRLSFRSDVGDGESIYAQESTSSREGPGWLSLRTAGGEALDISGRCDLCACPDSGGLCVGCPVCGPAPDVVAALSGAGGVIEHRWDGLVHTTGTCDAGELAICSAPPTLAPPGDYKATFCWSAMATGVGMDQTIGMSSCEDVPFHLPDEDGLVEDAVCFCG